MCVYVAHTPKASLDDVVRVALRLRALGLTVSPHIVARRVADLDRLADARCGRWPAAGVEQILLIAGDRAAVARLFHEHARAARIASDAGCRASGGSALPDIRKGIPVVPEAELWEALERKQAFGRGDWHADAHRHPVRVRRPRAGGLGARARGAAGSRCRSMPASQGPRRSPGCSSTPCNAVSALRSRRCQEMP